MKVAVIGAGLTGSMVADFLSQTGHQVTVFEKSRGPGGRLTHKRFDWGRCDLGANEIRATDPRFRQFLNQLMAQQLVARWQANACYFESVLKPEPVEFCRFVFTPGMNAVCRHLLQGVELHRSVKIAHLHRAAAGWMLWDEDERKYTGFDWVVVTAPWPQTQPILAEHMTVPKFNEGDWLPCWTVAIQTQHRINTEAEIIYPRSGPVQSIYNDSAKPRRDSEDNIWVIQLTHDKSRELHKAGEADVLPLAVQQLELATGEEVTVAEHYKHFWRYARMHPDGEVPGIIFEPELSIAGLGDWSVGGSIQAVYRAVQQFKQCWS